MIPYKTLLTQRGTKVGGEPSQSHMYTARAKTLRRFRKVGWGGNGWLPKVLKKTECKSLSPQKIVVLHHRGRGLRHVTEDASTMTYLAIDFCL